MYRCSLGYELDDEIKCNKCTQGYTYIEHECVLNTEYNNQNRKS
jgi:hypothetical protein